MKKAPQIFSAVHSNVRGKVAHFTVDQSMFQNDPDKEVNYIANKYDNYLKYSQATKTAEFNFPAYAKRLSERQRPCEVRKQKREDQFRKRDFAIVKDFCNWFMWSQAAYKPPVKK
jgi:hypothetical protein